MRGVLSALSWFGLAISTVLLLVGVGTVGVLVAAHLAVEPAVNLLNTVTGTATPVPVQQRVQPEVPSRGVMYTTEERVVNLADRGSLRYLKAQVVLEFAVPGDRAKGAPDPDSYKKTQEEFRRELAGRAPIIDDRITMILSSKSTADLMTPEGKTQLKQEIKDRLGEVLEDRQLMNVYFTRFIVQ